MKRDRTAIEHIEWMRNLLSFILVGAFVGALMVFTFFALPEGNKDIITYMVGQLSGMALTVLSFYYVNKVGQDAVDAKRVENTGKLADAVTTALKSGPSTDAAADAAEETADAAKDKAEEFKK